MPMTKEHLELHIAVKQADGHQQTEDSAKSSVQWICDQRRTKSHAGAVDGEAANAVPITEIA